MADHTSDNFRKWFGESKVVDSDGLPLRVFHGTCTRRNFARFSPKMARGWAANNALGHFFTRSPENASAYSELRAGSRVVPVFLSIQNPYIQHVYEWQAQQGGSWSAEEVDAFKVDLLAKGHDGIIDSAGMEFIAFHATAIKSALGNAGAYDPRDPDITDRRASKAMAARSFLNSLADRAKPHA